MRDIAAHVLGRERCGGGLVTLEEPSRAPGLQVVYCNGCHGWEARRDGAAITGGSVFDYAAGKHLRDQLAGEGRDSEVPLIEGLLENTREEMRGNSRMLAAA